MNLNVINRGLSLGDINIGGVSAGAVFLIGDAEQICSSSVFDTPPESLIVGVSEATLVPLASTS